MKRIIKVILLSFVVFAVMVAAVGLRKENITMYNANGENIQILISQIEEYELGGWYSEPLYTMHNPNGNKISVVESKIQDYKAQGWFMEPPVTMYSSDGRTVFVEPADVEAYKAANWFTEPFVTIYSANGEAASVLKSEVANYCANGWFTEMPEREGLVELRTAIESFIKQRRGEWGVFVQNLATNEYMLINEKKYSSASLIKLFTAAAVINQIEQGVIASDGDIEHQLRLMITESSNIACNYLTKRLGGGNTKQGFHTENKYTNAIGFTNTYHGSELIDRSGQKAIFIGYNQTSPADCGRLLVQVYKGKLISEVASKKLLGLLLDQTHTWKIPDSLPEGVTVANKTGETSKVEGDAAIVYSPACDYVISVIGNGDVATGVGTIQEISRMTYNYFNK
ncbi:MAG: serine hydrolase [Clostridia bacterium]|nr:serine hydrolase [Clostridia bacterium]